MEREREKNRRTKAERQGKKGGLKAGRFKEAKTEKERNAEVGETQDQLCYPKWENLLWVKFSHMMQIRASQEKERKKITGA